MEPSAFFTDEGLEGLDSLIRLAQEALTLADVKEHRGLLSQRVDLLKALQRQGVLACLILDAGLIK
jgi:hypothetical protein